jgi:hypothetical protein
MVRGVSSSEKLFIIGDLNGHVGTTRRGFEMIHGDFGYGKQNQDGEQILNFVVPYDLMVANTFFRKKKNHILLLSTAANTRAKLILSLLKGRKDQTV